jgi:uncharacterized protein (DUF2147 family)
MIGALRKNVLSQSGIRSTVRVTSEHRMGKTGLIVAALITICSITAALADDIVGTWQMEDGNVSVEVGRGEKSLYGRIVALQRPLDKNGNPLLDKENPDPALRSRPIVGLTVFQDMKVVGPNRWEGPIYVPADGNTYEASVYVSGGALKVQGCVAIILCRTKKFVRIDGDPTVWGVSQ